MIAKRRGEDVAPATVNHTVIMPLRAILRHAEIIASATIKPIDWKALKLKEPQERLREASVEEEAAALTALRGD